MALTRKGNCHFVLPGMCMLDRRLNCFFVVVVAVCFCLQFCTCAQMAVKERMLILSYKYMFLCEQKLKARLWGICLEESHQCCRFLNNIETALLLSGFSSPQYSFTAGSSYELLNATGKSIQHKVESQNHTTN